jgi:hypothetical protein
VSLLRAERGAAMVAGLLFAVFLLAMVFYILGIAEAVLFRERMQDAADTAAFSAAVVHARGMNLIALINLTMAAVLAILVALRLAETLCYVGIVVCGILAYPTAGASTSGIAPLANAAKQIHDFAENLKDPINQALSVLHSAGEAVAKVVPLGANVRVLDQTASHYGVLGVAIPARLTLPVEDDTFTVLCEHAGRDAGELALLPISPVLPSSVEKELGDVAGKIVAAGPGWFCGGSGEPPDFNDDSESQLEELPRLPSEEACASFTSSGTVSPDVAPEEVERVCTRASVERLASTPARDGSPRSGQPLCPTHCQHSENPRCPPVSVQDCAPDESARLESDGDRLLPPDAQRVLHAERAALARTQCRPVSAGGQGGLLGAWWVEREVERTYAWKPAARTWVEDESGRIMGPTRLVQRDSDDDTLPCGQHGAVGESYELDPQEPACRGLARCLVGSAAIDAACSRAAPLRGAQARFRERTLEVVHILRCAREREADKVATPTMNLGEEFGSSEQDDEPRPFKLESGVYLGGSDLQVRALVVGEVPAMAEGVLAMTRWGQEQPGDAASEVLTALGRVAVGQAEYFFDWSELGGELDDQTDDGDRTEWLWNMGWRARLRPFRLRQSAADAPRDDQGSQSQDGALDCTKLGDVCADAQAVAELEGEGE